MKCYQCETKESLPELTAFCSIECKEEYNKINPQKKILNSNDKPKRTIAEVQARLLEMALEKRKQPYQTTSDIVKQAQDIFNY